jgi:signal transduction histidine kinase/DNA-binding response OmpR family regulator
VHTWQNGGQEQKNLLEKFYLDNIITLKSSERNLALQFGFPDYRTDGFQEFSYRLDGTDTTWIHTKTSEIQLAGLGYGRHLLLVRAKSRHGITTSKPYGISIVVFRPFYLQGWFILLIFSLFAFGTYAVIQRRIQKIMEHKKYLEAEVARRTAKISADKETIQMQALELKQREEEKSRFFANISHEFRTPLSLILGPVNHLRKRLEGDSNNSEMLEIAYKNAGRLLEMVNAILSLSSLDSQKYILALKPVSPVQFLKNLQNEYLPLAYDRKIDLYFDINIDPNVILNLDSGLLRIVLDNLLSNAMKFTQEDGKISLYASFLEDKLIIAVEDSGIGIPKEELPKIFERFYKVRSPFFNEEDGTGIGLSLASELAALMGGKIRATSKKGVGSIFHLDIPAVNLMTETKPDQLQSPTQVKRSNRSDKWLGTRMLIVDDNRDFQTFFELLLKPHYSIRVCSNPEDAIQLFESGFKPNIIILDIMMPKMDGFSFLTYLKKNPETASIPVLITTARAAGADQLKALQFGVDDYLVKPFEEEVLFDTIVRLLDRHAVRIGIANEDESISEKKDPLFHDSSNDMEWLAMLQEKVNENLQREAFSVDELAGFMFSGRTAFYKKVQRLSGLTPNQYIIEARLLKARSLLEQEPRITIKSLIPQIGLKHEEHFNRVFKERFGMSPADFKKDLHLLNDPEQL